MAPWCSGQYYILVFLSIRLWCHKEHPVKTWRGNATLLNVRLHVCLYAFHTDAHAAFCFLLKADKRIYGRRYRSLLHIITSSALAKLNLLTLQGFTFDGVWSTAVHGCKAEHLTLSLYGRPVSPFHMKTVV